MRITVGKVPLGKVRTQDHQSIQTEFLVLGVPILPLRSLFSFRDSNGIERYFELNGLHRISCLCGYLRDLSVVATVISLLISGIILHDAGYDMQILRERYGFALFVPVMGLIGLAVYLACRSLDRSSPEERKKRSILGACVGYNCLPIWPRLEVRKKILAGLEEHWSRAHGGAHGKDWTTAVGKGDLPGKARELIYALASYKHSVTGRTQDGRLEEQAWGAL